MKVLTKLTNAGRCVMVTIPEEALELESLQPGDTVKLKISKIRVNGRKSSKE